MWHFLSINTADVAIGHLDKASLSQQALMELVVQGIINKEYIFRGETEATEIGTWMIVRLEDNQVTIIDWAYSFLQGVLHMEWLPLTVRRIEAYSNQLTGTIDLSHLPHSLEYVDLSTNGFTGSIDLHTLPEGLRHLQMNNNNLTGTVDFTRLPGKLHELHLHTNHLSGALDLTNLPPHMAELRLQENCFSGTLDLGRLPGGIKFLNLSKNQFSGEVFIVPALFCEVNVENTTLTKRILEIAALGPKHVRQRWQTSLMDQFYASITEDGKNELSKGNTSNHHCEWISVTCAACVVTGVNFMYNPNKQWGNFNVHSLPPTVERIGIRYRQQKYVPQTRAFPRELKICKLDHNELFGSVELRTLPRQLAHMNLSYNKLTGPIALTSLPCSLEYLHLGHNRIVQSVVYHDRLPFNAKHIELVKKKSPTNRIGMICAVQPDMAVENKAVFSPISEKNIR